MDEIKSKFDSFIRQLIHNEEIIIRIYLLIIKRLYR
jgi:hypothetical protein